MRIESGYKFLVTVLLFGMLQACGGTAGFGGSFGNNNNNGATGVPGVVTLDSVADQVVADGTSTLVLTATLLDTAGLPLAGKTLNFTTDVGTLSSAPGTVPFAASTTNQTDRNGQAIVFLRSTNQQRTASVIASESVTSLSAARSIIFAATGSNVTVASLNLDSDLSSIPADGRSTIALTATLLDSAGNPVSGRTLSFTTTAGTLRSSTGVTNNQGQVIVLLSSSTQQGNAVVSVTDSSTLSANATFLFTAGVAASITLTPAPTTIAPGGVASVFVQVNDAGGNPVPNTTVTFSVPTNVSGGRFSAAVGNTDANGRINGLTYTAGPTIGTDTLQATSAGVPNSNRPTIRVETGVAQIGSILFEVGSSTARADGSTRTGVRATVRGTGSGTATGPVLANVTVNFTTSAGSLSAASAVTDGNGIAQISLISPTQVGVARLTAETGGLSGTPQTVTFIAGPVARVDLSLAATSLTPGATTQAIATAFDANSNRVPGVQVVFITSRTAAGARFVTQAGSLTNANGEVIATYTAPSESGFPDSVTASVDSRISSAIAVTLSATSARVPATITLVASAPSLQSGASTAAQGVTITALVKDSNNNLLPGIPVSFRSARLTGTSCGNGGALVPIVITAGTAAGTTDSAGSAAAALTTGGDSQNQIITVTASAAPAPEVSLNINVTGTTLSFSGQSNLGLNASSTYTVTLRDSAARGIPNQSVTVSPATTPTGVSTIPGNTFALSSSGTPARSVTGTTDATGQISILYSAISGGVDTLAASIPNNCATAATQAIQVSSQSFRFVAGPTSAPGLAVAQAFTVAALDASQNVAVSAADITQFAVDDLVRIDDDADGVETITGRVTAVDRTANTLAVTTTAITHGAAGGTMGSPATIARIDNEIAIGAAISNITRFQTAAVRLSGGTPAGQTITFSTTRGFIDNPADGAAAATTATAATDANGMAFINIQQATGTSGTGGGVITASGPSGVSATQAFSVISTAPTKISLQATPNAIPVSTGTSSILATVRDNDNNPVQDATVNFTLSDASGGRLLASTGITNSQGQVSVTYAASSAPSARDGVSITATVPGCCTTASPVTLTVGGQALRIVLGTGNTIEADPSNPNTLYRLPYSVLVTDSAGNPPATGTTVSLLMESMAFQKGQLTCPIAPWAPVYTLPTAPTFGCLNEDVNRNGILDGGEDSNINLILDPGNVASVENSVILRADGTQVFSIIYPKDRANWVQVRLTAVVSVSGTESREVQTFVLPGAATDYDDCSIAPPGVTSPYGTSATCFDAL